MGIAERKLRQKEGVKASILNAAWNVVMEEGWQALSIRKIADAIEYSVPVVYSHFENKEAILLEFAKEGFRMLTDEVQKAKDSQKDPRKQLQAISKAYWDFAFTQKEHYQLMFGLGIPPCEKVNQVAELKALTQIMMTSIHDVIAMGKNTKADQFLKFHTFWSILHGLVSIQLIDQEGKSDPKKQLILQDAVDGFIKSLLEK
jgi:AcrR family transcriptional regulator